MAQDHRGRPAAELAAAGAAGAGSGLDDSTYLSVGPSGNILVNPSWELGDPIQRGDWEHYTGPDTYVFGNPNPAGTPLGATGSGTTQWINGGGEVPAYHGDKILRVDVTRGPFGIKKTIALPSGGTGLWVFDARVWCESGGCGIAIMNAAGTIQTGHRQVTYEEVRDGYWHDLQVEFSGSAGEQVTLLLWSAFGHTWGTWYIDAVQVTNRDDGPYAWESYEFSEGTTPSLDKPAPVISTQLQSADAIGSPAVLSSKRMIGDDWMLYQNTSDFHDRFSEIYRTHVNTVLSDLVIDPFTSNSYAGHQTLQIVPSALSSSFRTRTFSDLGLSTTYNIWFRFAVRVDPGTEASWDTGDVVQIGGLDSGAQHIAVALHKASSTTWTVRVHLILSGGMSGDTITADSATEYTRDDLANDYLLLTVHLESLTPQDIRTQAWIEVDQFMERYFDTSALASQTSHLPWNTVELGPVDIESPSAPLPFLLYGIWEVVDGTVHEDPYNLLSGGARSPLHVTFASDFRHILTIGGFPTDRWHPCPPLLHYQPVLNLRGYKSADFRSVVAEPGRPSRLRGNSIPTTDPEVNLLGHFRHIRPYFVTAPEWNRGVRIWPDSDGVQYTTDESAYRPLSASAPADWLTDTLPRPGDLSGTNIGCSVMDDLSGASGSYPGDQTGRFELHPDARMNHVRLRFFWRTSTIAQLYGDPELYWWGFHAIFYP